MSIVNTNVGSTTDGTYGLPNAIIGQIKAVIDDDTNVTIISDNNPDNTTMRVLIYEHSGSDHRVKIATTSGTQITFYLLKIDDSTTLTSQAVTVTSGSSYPFRFLYNSKAHFWVLSTSTAVKFFAINTDDPTYGWYVKSMSSIGFYYNGSDTGGSVDYPYYSYLDSDSKYVGMPVRFKITGIFSAYYHDYFYGVTNLHPAGFYSDGTYNYLSDGALMIADRVPA